MLALTDDLQPLHVFCDYEDFLLDSVRLKVNSMEQCDVLGIKRAILAHPTKTSAWCVKHGKYCNILRADDFTGGHPCVHHSKLGKQEGMAGKSNIAFFTMCRQRIDLKEPMATLENVQEFGLGDIEDALAGVYCCKRFVLDPCNLGWKTHRTRQFVSLELRGLNMNIPAGIFKRQPGLAPISVLLELFERRAEFKVKDYCTAPDAELAEEAAWAGARKEVMRRIQDKVEVDGKGRAIPLDDQSTYLSKLTPSERGRLLEYQKMHPGAICDLNHEPKARCIHSDPDSDLFTLTRSMGLIWHPQLGPDGTGRWMATTELAMAMGYPVDDDDVLSTDGCNIFSRLSCKSGVYSRSSASAQLGNAMHVNSIGAITMAKIFAMPSAIFGGYEIFESGPSSSSASSAAPRILKRKASPTVQQSEFGQAFQAAKKKQTSWDA